MPPTTTTLTTTTTGTTTPALDDLNYVALGDSYSSGEGAPHPTTAFVWNGRNSDVRGVNICHRSASAYGPRVAAWLGLTVPDEFHFVACSGAVSNFLTRPNSVNAGEQPQYNAFFEPDEQTDLVTITIGGNDMGFGTIAEFCVLTENCHADAAFAPGIEAMMRGSTPIWKAIYDQIKARTSPGTRVIVLTYPQIFSTGAGCAGTGWAALNVGERTWLRLLWSTLNLQIRKAAQQAGIEVVDVERAFKGQLICDALPYANGLHTETGWNPLRNSMYSFHPNALGQGRMGTRVYDAVEAGPPAAGAAAAADGTGAGTATRRRSASLRPRSGGAVVAGAIPDPAATLSTGPIQTLDGFDENVIIDPDGRIGIRIDGFAAGSAVQVFGSVVPDGPEDAEPAATLLGQATADGAGSARLTITAPDGTGHLVLAASGTNDVGGRHIATAQLWRPEDGVAPSPPALPVPARTDLSG